MSKKTEKFIEDSLKNIMEKTQEIIDLTKQVDDLTSDNVDLKEKLKHMRPSNRSGYIKFMEEVIDKLEKQKDILWEYISDKDIDKISTRFNKIEC